MSKKLIPKFYDSGNPKIMVVLGPTASGKSDLAVQIASSSILTPCKGVNIKGAEVISADSRQVYKKLNLGSGKITKKEMCGVPHHLLDVTSPKNTFTVTQYQKIADKAIKKIIKNNKIPIICGGTGLYIDSIIYNQDFPEVPPQPKLREKLEKKSTQELFDQLKKLDTQRASNIDKHNRRRLIRALEIIITTKKSVPMRQSRELNPDYDILLIGIKLPPKELKTNIKKRLYKRLKLGMIKEVENLHKQGLSWKRLDDLGLEYRFISRYLRKLISKNEMEESILKESWQYAKRQMTWFKRNTNIHWIQKKSEAKKLINNFMNIR